MSKMKSSQFLTNLSANFPSIDLDSTQRSRLSFTKKEPVSARAGKLINIDVSCCSTDPSVSHYGGLTTNVKRA